MTWIAGAIVAMSGLWLVGLALALLVVPNRAEQFLAGFASTARAHFTEHTLRLIAGVGMIGFADQMKFPRIFDSFGWLLIVTGTALLLLPWTWHRRFAKWVVPPTLKYRGLFAIGALGIGLFILYAMV